MRCVRRYSRAMTRVRFGLCDRCEHQRLVRSGRGSLFTLCERAREDQRFPRYPRVPVTACAGFEARAGRGEGGTR